MAAIIRVKRRLDEDPAESLIVQYKKCRTDGSTSAEPAKLCLSLVTTVKSKEAALSSQLQKTLRRHQLQTNYKSHGSKRIAQNRSETSAKSKSNRYKIVTSKRPGVADSVDENGAGGESGHDSNVENDTENKTGAASESEGALSSELETTSGGASPVTGTESSGASSDVDAPVIHDVEVEGGNSGSIPSSGSGITLNGQVLVSEQVPVIDNYVYDLYYLNHASQLYDFREIENILSIEAFHDSLVSDADRLEECDEVYDDDDDSNDESNWRNDYPDEDPDDDHVELDIDYYTGLVNRDDSYSYRSRLEDDDFLAEAMGTRLQIFGDSNSEGDISDRDDLSDNNDFSYGRDKLPSYDSYMKKVRHEVNGETSDHEDSD